ncbi:YbaN family protein [Bdellovibrio sp. SKB1291214]|uniref:YbaN family protein n=1 Tax=Bdellovibrio sp. SKB1291214 TaxID=1732569 RepID=UPI001C3E4610|nr:YbaN family protein [Bdellovibrio sp. SKB1291214]UYL07468.1 YbaN family protein [Bdellovibrio sp. SKB1291214]
MGIIGVFLPILPTTPFVILSAWCFVRSSKKAHAWLYRQPLFGPALKNWDEKRAISRRAKLLAVSMILVSLTVMWLRIQNQNVLLVATAVLVSVSIFIATRNEPTD